MMGVKKTIKRAGRFFFSLKQDDDAVFKQEVLVVDNGNSSTADLRAAIKKAQYCFPGAKIALLGLVSRGPLLQEEFPQLEKIICSRRLWPRRYSLALQLLALRRRKFDFIVNFSLDPSPLLAEMFLFKSRILLYNQWGQWCSLRLKRVSEIFRGAYHKARSKNNLKNLIKRIGLFFVLLTPDDEQALSHKILFVDESAGIITQLIYASRRVKESLPFSRVDILTAAKGREIEQESRAARIIRPEQFFIKKYRLAWQMFKLRKNNYDFLILLSLDITPIIIGSLFIRGRLLLNNQWHQWWRLSLKPAGYYLMLPLRLLANLISRTILLIFLGASVLWIYLLRAFNVFKTNLLSEGN